MPERLCDGTSVCQFSVSSLALCVLCVPAFPEIPEEPKKAAQWAAFFEKVRVLELLDVRGLGALLALGHFEADALVLVQCTEAATLDGGVVDEEVSAALVGGDEAEALLGVEPLDGTLCHDCFLPYVW